MSNYDDNTTGRGYGNDSSLSGNNSGLSGRTGGDSYGDDTLSGQSGKLPITGPQHHTY